MIIGIGTDLANIERIQGTLDRFGDRFRNRVVLGRRIVTVLASDNCSGSGVGGVLCGAGRPGSLRTYRGRNDGVHTWPMLAGIGAAGACGCVLCDPPPPWRSGRSLRTR